MGDVDMAKWRCGLMSLKCTWADHLVDAVFTLNIVPERVRVEAVRDHVGDPKDGVEIFPLRDTAEIPSSDESMDGAHDFLGADSGADFGPQALDIPDYDTDMAMDLVVRADGGDGTLPAPLPESPEQRPEPKGPDEEGVGMANCPEVNIRLDGPPEGFKKERIPMIPFMLCITGTKKQSDLSGNPRELYSILAGEPPVPKKQRCDDNLDVGVVCLRDSPPELGGKGKEPSGNPFSFQPLPAPPRQTAWGSSIPTPTLAEPAGMQSQPPFSDAEELNWGKAQAEAPAPPPEDERKGQAMGLADATLRAWRREEEAVQRCPDLYCAEVLPCPGLRCPEPPARPALQCPAAPEVHCPACCSDERGAPPRAAGNASSPEGGPPQAAPRRAPLASALEGSAAAGSVAGWLTGAAVELLGGSLGVFCYAVLVVAGSWRVLQRQRLKLWPPRPPDGDVYCETYGGIDHNIAAVRWSDVRRHPPPGVPRDSYRFRGEITPAESMEFQRLARIAARDEFVARDRRHGGPGVEPAGGALLPLAADARETAGRSQSGAEVRCGRPLQRVSALVLDLRREERGCRAWGALACIRAAPGPRGPAAVLVRRMKYGEVSRYLRVEFNDDARVLPVELLGDRRQRLTWRHAVERPSVTPFADWPIWGPLTVEWVMRFLDRRGGGPGDHHAWWRQVNRLQRGDWGVDIHENGSRALETAASYDNLELANPASLEVTARECQLVEYAYSREPIGGPVAESGDKNGKKDQKGKGRPRAGLLDESDVFMGRHREAAIDTATDELVDALNDIYRAPRGGSPRRASRPTLAQRLALDHLRQRVVDLGPPPEDLDGPGAFDELRSKLAYDGSSSRLGPLRVDLLDLPPPGFHPVTHSEAAGPAGELIEKRLLDKLLKRLRAANLLVFRFSVRRRVGCFSVWKKSGAQRLVIDARIPNCFFEEPDPVQLASGACFANLQLDAGPPLVLGGADIKVAFYAIAMPEELRDLFGFEPIKAWELGVTHAGGEAVKPGDRVFPVIAVLPMGWVLALQACQSLHELLARREPDVGEHNALADGRPPPGLEPIVHTEYVDNFACFGRDPAVVRDVVARVRGRLVAAGLPMHEAEVSVGGDALGWHFTEGGRCSMSLRTAWRLRLALLHVVKLGRASGREMSALLGHFTTQGLIRREVFSAPQACFAFAQQFKSGRGQLWPSVYRELRWMASLVFVAARELDAPWRSKVHVFDASEWGCGVIGKTIDTRDVVVSIGHLLFRSTSGGETGAESLPSDGPLEITKFTSNLDRTSSSHSKRHLILGDAMTVILSRTKGRGASFGLCRALRRSAALVLAANLRPAWRWLPSEWNAADAASRKRRSTCAGGWSPRDLVRGHGVDDGRDELAGDLRFHGRVPTARRAAHPPAPRARGAPGQRTVLERRSVSAWQESEDRDQCDRFLTWAKQQRLRTSRLKDLEATLVEMLNQMFYDGWRSNTASKMVAAAAYFRPEAGPGCSSLSRVQLARRGFSRLDPPQARLPLPWAAACLVARRLAKGGSWHMAAAVLFAFIHYLRPCELLRLRECDLAPPPRQSRQRGRRWSVILHPQELAITSKTGARDETVLVDNVEEFAFLERLLARLRGSGGEQLVFPFSYREWAKGFEAASTAVGLVGDSLPVLYMLRHGGASHDAMTGARGLRDIQGRCRWMTERSVVRHKKGGRAVRRAADSAVQNISVWLLRS
ncbi:unnamed protein product [Prorocentrum cordatum]|uniref:Reverse transcriptase domain-containing protein n=1 Tax=Prorocentrum cordatum TaxID=2364126 RepID=A0ABN9RQT5_9DINO|nr:unnamed protein product [Polarella glacialis]